MGRWEFQFALDPSSREPLFLQVARAVREDIRRGRLQPGDALPGYRTLADRLEVARNTILAAYQELMAEGWLEARPGGTYVAPEPPESSGANTAASGAPAMGFDLDPSPRTASPETFGREVLTAVTGVPDPRLLPMAALARAYRRAMQLHGHAALRSGDPQGHPRLREALATMLKALRGIPASPDSLLVTRGSQMGIFLLAEALLRPGDRVAVEALGHRPFWDAFRRAGAELVPLPVDEGGARIDALESLLAEGPLRAAFLTPQRQYPTIAPLAAERRQRLMELARQHRFAILENDFDATFQYEGRPQLPLAAEDPHGLVIHVGTLSKVIAPGLRLGFVHGPRPLVDRLRDLRGTVDQEGDAVLELAVAELLEDGEVERHLLRMRKVCEARRDALAEALRATFGDRLRFRIPEGGMALWLEATGVDTAAWARRALKEGIAFRSGGHYTFDGGRMDTLRLGFALHEEAELREAVRRMDRAFADA